MGAQLTAILSIPSMVEASADLNIHGLKKTAAYEKGIDVACRDELGRKARLS